MTIRKILSEMDASRPADNSTNGDLPSPELKAGPEATADGTTKAKSQPGRPADQSGELAAVEGTDDKDPAAKIEQGKGTEVQGNIAEESTFAEDFKATLLESFEFKVDTALVEGLMESQELEAEFKEQAIELFESMVGTTIKATFETIAAQAATALEEAVVEHAKSLEEALDAYTQEVAAEWLKENQVAVDQGIKVTVAESFMEGLKGLLEDHYIELPEGKRDALEESIRETKSIAEQLEEETNISAELYEINLALRKALMVESFARSMSLTQAEKVRQLSEGLEFTSEEKFKGQLALLKESLGKATAGRQTMLEDVQPLEEQAEAAPAKVVDEEVALYAKQMSRFAGR